MMLCIDLGGGLGGWAEGFLAEGFRVVGFDINPRFASIYPGEFVIADVRRLDGHRFRKARCIVASPVCNPYVQLPWYRPPPDDGFWDAVERIRQESRVPTVIENVRGAERFRGKAVCHVGSRYLWGDVPLLNVKPVYGKTMHIGPSPNRPAIRSKIPFRLARAIAKGFL